MRNENGMHSEQMRVADIRTVDAVHIFNKRPRGEVGVRLCVTCDLPKSDAVHRTVVASHVNMLVQPKSVCRHCGGPKGPRSKQCGTCLRAWIRERQWNRRQRLLEK